MRNKYFIYSLVCSIVLTGFSKLYAQENQDNADFYTKIAAQGKSSVSMRPMDTIIPEKLAIEKQLFWKGNRSSRYHAPVAIRNQKQINKALDKLREKHAVFFQDFAPKMDIHRISQEINTMQFRYETVEDQQDFIRLVQGLGDWETVKIPYYHGPEGVSTAWYRKELIITDSLLSSPALIWHFNGADYYTDAFINGHHVGYHEGMLDEFEFDIKPYVKPGKNILLVKLRNDYSMLGTGSNPRYFGNKIAACNSLGWDEPFTGWMSAPAGYGLYQKTYIESRSTPYIADLYCRPLVDKSSVEIWAEIELPNGNEANDYSLKYALYGQNFKTTICENKTEQIEIVGGRVLHKFTVQIPKKQLRLWDTKTPWLYQFQLALCTKNGEKLLDNCKKQFGMRTFVIDRESTPMGRMYLNDKEIRLRGTNTMGFLQKSVKNENWNQLIDDMLLIKLSHMNFIRTTQRTLSKEVYEYADKLGILIQSDLPLFAYVNQKQYAETIKQAEGAERLLRNHPSAIILTYINEPMAEVKPHAISRYAYERLFDALDIVVHNQNPDRAVKYVDGDYQAPSNGYPDNHCYNIWYDEHEVPLEQLCRGAWLKVNKGWMYGCGEYGAEALDPSDLMKRRYPKEWLVKQADGKWNPKVLMGENASTQTWDSHWDWFETQHSMDDWVFQSQLHQAWGVKKATRAFRRMARMNSFAIHLFIDAWPNGWMKAIMDCERTPKPAWFAYRDALTPLCVQVESERSTFFSGEKYPFQIWICNDTHQSPDVELNYMLKLNGRLIDSGSAVADVPTIKDAVSFQGFLNTNIPSVKKRTELTLSVAIVDKETRKVLHQDVIQCDIFPKTKKTTRRKLHFVGSGDEVKSMKKVLAAYSVSNQNIFSSKDVIVVGDSISLNKEKMIIDAVDNGATAFILKGAITKKKMFQLPITFDKKEDSSWSIERNIKQPIWKGTKSNDLKYNFSATLQMPERHYFKTFESKGFIPLITYNEKMILGEKKFGKGKWIISSLKLSGKLEATPVLVELVQNLISEKR